MPSKSLSVVAAYLKSSFASGWFCRELTEIGEYAANVKQERQIVNVLARQCWRSGHDVILEFRADSAIKRTKCDLRLDGVSVEFKFHYHTDIGKASDELRKNGREVPVLGTGHAAHGRAYLLSAKISGRSVQISSYGSICERDLSSCSEEGRKRIAWAKEQRRSEKRVHRGGHR